MPDTLDYYRANAQHFFDVTVEIDVQSLYTPFLECVPAGGHILDAGCGSGRDAKAFLARGFRVTAFDAAPELAALAAQHTGLDVHVLRFQDIDYRDTFDGIWTCASLLHVPRAEIEDVFARLIRALKVGGAWYISFKHGDGEAQQKRRLFNNYTEAGLRALLDRFPELAIIHLATNDDQRPHVSNQQWVSAVVQRRFAGE